MYRYLVVFFACGGAGFCINLAEFCCRILPFISWSSGALIGIFISLLELPMASLETIEALTFKFG